MSAIFWSILWIAAIGYLLYHRTTLQPFTAITGIGLVITTIFHPFSGITLFLLWAIYLAIFVPLNLPDIRKKYITQYLYDLASKSTPTISDTEKIALESGHTWWEGELFRGNPDWKLLINYPKPILSKEEQDFLDGPVEQLCSMVIDWEVTHINLGLSSETISFIKNNGFLGMIIPKTYGGLGFSAVAHTAVVTKLASASVTLSTTVAVPNSLGPAELLLHYGTEEQKNYYLPRLAKGEEIPCFALTSPDAGSDATSINDNGIICKGEYNGKSITGIKLNFKKRYITLAPDATIIGLAFKLYDPDNLLGNNIQEYGITCALIPRGTHGITIGDRHFPLNSGFSNGPIVGKDVFVPLDFIIGGIEMAGHGWRMLMECLAVGRSISLPSTSSGGMNSATLLTGAYSRIRKQFNTPICGFEGIQEALARIIGFNNISNAARLVTASAIDRGIKPSVISGIVKCHVTELGRKCALDAMDIHGGKGICLGPNNYVGRGYQAAPIAITVEGANILTRNMMIFGQGAIRCHPFALEEMTAIVNKDLEHFDNLIYKHAGYMLSNMAKSFWLGLTMGVFSNSPTNDSTKKYYQWINRFSANLAFAADFMMANLGGDLKRKEGISARLGDILSYTYLMSAVLKHHNDQNSPMEELAVVDWSCRYLAYQTQRTLIEVCDNYPNKLIGWLIKFITVPVFNYHKIPSDALNKQLVKLVSQPSSTRSRLMQYVSNTKYQQNFITKTESILANTVAAEPIAKRLQTAIKEAQIDAIDYPNQVAEAIKKSILTESEAEILLKNHEEIMSIINVDQFKTEELISYSATTDKHKNKVPSPLKNASNSDIHLV